MRYAIVEDGIITNMIKLEPINAYEFPNAIYAEEWDIQIGDLYNSDDGNFYRGEEKLLSVRERMYQLEQALTLLTGEASQYSALQEFG